MVYGPPKDGEFPAPPRVLVNASVNILPYRSGANSAEMIVNRSSSHVKVTMSVRK